MFKKSIFTFFLLFLSFLTIYPSKRENTSLFDYCYPFEKILSRNSLEKSKKITYRIEFSCLHHLHSHNALLVYLDMLPFFKFSKVLCSLRSSPLLLQCYSVFKIECVLLNQKSDTDFIDSFWCRFLSFTHKKQFLKEGEREKFYRESWWW